MQTVAAVATAAGGSSGRQQGLVLGLCAFFGGCLSELVRVSLTSRLFSIQLFARAEQPVFMLVSGLGLPAYVSTAAGAFASYPAGAEAVWWSDVSVLLHVLGVVRITHVELSSAVALRGVCQAVQCLWLSRGVVGDGTWGRGW